ncbi:MAG: hypothetical protein ACKVWV_09850 [Planctomycetota bacterium]
MIENFARCPVPRGRGPTNAAATRRQTVKNANPLVFSTSGFAAS